MTRRFAHALVRHYPVAWRERYEREVLGLIDETRLRFRDLAELARGMLTERTRELMSADDRPRRTAAVLGLVKPVFSIVFVAAAYGTGRLLREMAGPWAEPARELAAIASVVFVAAFLVRCSGCVRGGRPTRHQRARLGSAQCSCPVSLPPCQSMSGRR